VRSIVDRIHAAAVAKFPKLHLGDDGLEGIMSMHSHSGKLHGAKINNDAPKLGH
jgi:hypothetical protein